MRTIGEKSRTTPVESEYSIPSEFELPIEEHFPLEHPAAYDEFNERVKYPTEAEEEAAKKQRRRRMLRYLLMSSVASVSVLLAAFGQDPLGSSKTTPGGPTTPVTPTIPTILPTIIPIIPDNPEGDSADIAFPALGNTDPDYAGDYAWVEKGTETSEEYLIYTDRAGNSHFLWPGGYYRSAGVPQDSGDATIQWDKENNVLKLNNFVGGTIETNLMGNGFTIEVEGDCEVDQIVSWGAMYAGSVTIKGSGRLTVNRKLDDSGTRRPYGILFQAEDSESALMIEGDVTVEVWGETAAVLVVDTQLKKAIYYLPPVYLEEGLRTSGKMRRQTAEDGSFLGVVWAPEDELTDEEKESGVYDHTILDSDGNMMTHVVFRPSDT